MNNSSLSVFFQVRSAAFSPDGAPDGDEAPKFHGDGSHGPFADPADPF